jgi:glutamyl-tRNA(Gln) amidotransferase subunit E
MQVDYAKVGLLVGLECHQQLATNEKLFCSCSPQLFRDDPEVTFLRGLRPTQSELGQVDPAAFFEFQKGIRIVYEANNVTSCLVEMDEEPPHELNREALEIALAVALMMNAKPVDEVHVMRKIVIDGSNTTGFQRTCVVALDGMIEVEGKEIPIQHISLEEDAARKMKEEGGSLIYYRIDRLGIPLIEVTTGPAINSPKEAERVALTIGQILRATGKAKRGIGTIRQDLNVSIRDGALMEVKGVQDLELVSKVVEYEVQRQLNLLKVRDEVKRRKLREEDIREEFFDVRSIFSETGCRVIGEAIKENRSVLAVKLRKFSGLLTSELAPGMRLGKEMADRARFWGRVGGIFHTDELPSYGISADEVEQLRQFMKTDKDDCIVFVADVKENAIDALRAVIGRAKEALKGVPEETRAPNPDGTTRYMRPRPGAARMYPETDVPPTQVKKGYLERLRSRLPELPGEKMVRLMAQYTVNEKLARQLLYSEHIDLFESVAAKTAVSPTVIAVALTETLKALRRDGVPVEKLSNQQITDVFKLVDSGKTAKEAVPEVLAWLANHERSAAVQAVEELGFDMISQRNLEELIDGLISKNEALVRKRGEGAFGILMGAIMREVRGRAEAEAVSRLLKDKLSRELR